MMPIESISKPEAFRHIGRAMFGLTWIGRLDWRDRYLLEVGPQGSSQPTAALQVDDVLKAERRSAEMRFQYGQVNYWLRRRRYPCPQVPYAKFVKKFTAEFPSAPPPRATSRPQPKAQEVASEERVTSRQPSRERARRALHAKYGNDLPDQASLPNSLLCKEVGDWLKTNNWPTVSDDTMLRAARRRK